MAPRSVFPHFASVRTKDGTTDHRRADIGSSQRDESAPRANEGSSRANDVRTAGNVVRTGADDVVVERPANRIRRPSATSRCRVG